MFKRIFVVAGLTVCLAISTGNAQAQLPQISTGLVYLKSAQSSDGNWDSAASQVETTATTVAALQTLKLLNQTGGTAYTAGTSWLRDQSPQSVDFIAERILALGLTDGSADALLPALDAVRGGWGGYDGYAVDILDTAYALRALRATGSGDVSTTKDRDTGSDLQSSKS
jgi:prenyltransferase beta subunit